jgi:hypothetical protein
LWFAPLCFALTAFIGRSDATFSEGYSVALIASGSLAISFVGPLHCAFVALKFRSYPSSLEQVRPRRVLLSWLAIWWPLLLGVPLASVCGILVVVGSIPRDSVSWLMLAVSFLTMLGCGALGIHLSRLLPAALAVPLGAVGLFCWLALPASGHNLLVRHMNSGFPGCCTQDQQPVASSIWASIVLMGTLSLLLLLSLVLPSWWKASRQNVAGSLLIGSAVAVGLAVTMIRAHPQPLTLLGVQDRSSDALECMTEERVRVCVWPEDAHRAGEAMNAVLRVNKALDELGMAKISEASTGQPGNTAVPFTASRLLNDVALQASVAEGALERVRSCNGLATGQVPAPAVAYLLQVSGLARDDLLTRFAPEELEDLPNSEQPRSPDAQRWLEEALGADPACGA